MTAEALSQERHVLADDTFVEIVVWRVPRPVKGSTEGDHRHVGNVEEPYSFISYEKLLADFWADVDAWRQRR